MMKLSVTITDPSNKPYRQLIIVADWDAAKTRAEQMAKNWADANSLSVDEVEVHMTANKIKGPTSYI